MVTNKFFNITPPPGDPGSTDPSDRPFLNFTKRQQTQNSTLPITPSSPPPMANQFGEVFERPNPVVPIIPGGGPPPDYTPNIDNDTYAPEFRTFETDVTADRKSVV